MLIREHAALKENTCLHPGSGISYINLIMFPGYLSVYLSRDNYLGHDTSIVVFFPISELNVAELFQETFSSLHLGPYV